MEILRETELFIRASVMLFPAETRVAELRARFEGREAI
jgi:hypothetical protein